MIRGNHDIDDINIMIFKVTASILAGIICLGVSIFYIFRGKFNIFEFLLFIVFCFILYMLFAAIISIFYLAFKALYLELAHIAYKAKMIEKISLSDTKGYIHFSSLGFLLGFYKFLNTGYFHAILYGVIGAVFGLVIWCIYILIFNNYYRIFSKD